ncbi:MAG: hypothetical protein DLM56_00325 [Pseudonocardiales bacterium]|nr:MAG: hypothetical protein DLM56_00325 [Pseudonocardiales bacterium]
MNKLQGDDALWPEKRRHPADERFLTGQVVLPGPLDLVPQPVPVTERLILSGRAAKQSIQMPHGALGAPQILGECASCYPVEP